MLTSDKRLYIRINGDLLDWIKRYAQQKGTTASALAKGYFESLRDGNHSDATNCADAGRTDFEVTHLTELLEEKADQNQHIQSELTEKNQQINHLTQLLAVSQKSIQQLTQQNQLLLEDKRKPLWRRLFRR